MDGYEVLAELKKDTATRDIPLIALSADAMPVDIEKGLDAGFAHYITKPINVDQFLNTIEHYLREQ
jgi:CheY-like chemotaxis protein